MPSSGVFLCLDSGVLFGTGRAVVEYASLWQFKIQPSNGVHSVDFLVLYGNAIYSIRGKLFNGIKSKQNHTGDVCINYLRCFILIESLPVSDMRPIGEGLIKRKVFAGAHTI